MTPPPASDGASGGHYVYVLRCADDSYYTGYTTDPARRVAEHNAGDGAKYTRGRTPVECVYLEAHDSKSAAMSREYEIKQHSRAAKEALVADGDASLPTDDASLAGDTGSDTA